MSHLDYFSYFIPINVRPSTELPYTNTHERIKIIKFGFLFERCILGIDTSKNLTLSHEDSRSKSRMQFLTTFLDPIDRITSIFFVLKV